MADDTIFRRKSCVIITGASRGLGKCITLRFSDKFPPSSVFVLLARDLTALEHVKGEIQNLGSNAPTVIVKQFDQGQIDRSVFDNLFPDIFAAHSLKADDFEQAVIVHNAGTLGDNSKYVRELTDADLVRKNFDVNVTGMILLNTSFLRHFSDESKSRFVIHLSSLAAITPFSSMSLYCTGKAARDMFFNVLAVEEPTVRILSYAPGPCETDMQRACRENMGDPEVKKVFQEMHDKGRTLDCDTSITKLVDILQLNNFKNAQHIDYFDDLGGHVAIKKED